jgi:assimilatory nitrate reductase catalytic subunit
MTSVRSLADKASRLLLDRSGPLTRELVRAPGGFGLGQVPARLAPDATTTAVCGFCSTGCGLELHLKGGEAVNLSPSTDYPVNLGMACPKGWEALAPLRSSDRATRPLLRAQRGGRLAPVDWETALDTFVTRFKSIIERHGRESVAFLGTGQIPTEELALLGAVAKFGMGLVHGDGNTRQCMATAVVAYKQTFGFDAPPYTYADFEQSDVIVLVGSNLCIAHPILWERICKNQGSPKIIVIDPRRTETAMAATEHVPLRPKSDLVLFYGLAHLLIRDGHVDRGFVDAHTTRFEEFAAHVASYTPERVSAATGLSEETLERLAKTIHEGKRVSFWWTMGVNQSHEGVLVAEAIVALALMTGNIGRPGTGANSITGQCNAMGSRLFSNTTNLLGGRRFDNEEDRADVARILGIDVTTIPDRGSLAYDQIVEGIFSGRIKGLWVVATNSAHSWINQADMLDALSRLEFLVVQDMYTTTETAVHADLVLPAAGWGEKEGTFINSERRIGLLKRVSRAPGEALADFYIVKLIAEAWGCGAMFSQWESPEATFQLLKELSRGRPCDIAGIRDYGMLDELRGVQWPLPEGTTTERGSERRLFEDGVFFTDDGKARFVFGEPRAMPEPVDDRYPLLLLTGRGSSSQWHTQTRTAKSPTLSRLAASEPYVEVNPRDAEAAKIVPNQWVVVESRRGRMRARAYVSNVVQPGHLFVPMHYAKTNQLTFPSVDPESRQPSYKACAVRLTHEDSP